MADEAGAPGWASIGKAARALGVSKGAIRKRIEAGTLASRDDAGSTKVLLPFATTPKPVAAPLGPEAQPTAAADDSVEAASAGNAELAIRVAALTERAAQLAARLAEAQAERDRWLAAAAEARDDARAAVAARDEAERELRLLLARAQFEPALPSGASEHATQPTVSRRRWRIWRR
ncbi:MAG TPA: hypothetical protein VFI22_02255 [Thermomicrobiales bacterium]|nr:hypothetical protein [Thermomicrobiales bacterium]